MDARRSLPDSLLSDLSEFLTARIGLHFPPERWSDLERGVAGAARDFRHPDAEGCARWLLSAPLTRNQAEILASHLTIGETYFFRERTSFEILEQHILPGIIRARSGAEQRLRIWSAGCCTGEEPYSVAMLIDRLIPEPRAWNVTLLATDINPRFLRKAAEGVYGEWSFRDTPCGVKERYFEERHDRRFELHPHLRKRVTFSYLNLADDVYPSLLNGTNAMDVILCRNVLMYFSADRARQVVGNLYHSLADGGWLIVSPTEISHALFSSFTAVEFPGAVLYRKTTGAGAKVALVEGRAPGLDNSLTTVPVDPRAAASPVPEEMAPEPPARRATRSRKALPRGHDEREVFARTARICADQGRIREALEWCDKAVAADKLNPAVRYLLATVQQEGGQPDAAVLSLQRALYLDPDFALAHFALGNLRLSQGRAREAERHFTNALGALGGRPQDEVVPESDGLTAGRLAEIIAVVLASRPRAIA